MNYARNKEFGNVINKVIGGQHLTQKESYAAFCEVLNNEVSDLQQGAFLAALTTKGETSDEIAGGWQAIYEVDTNKTSLPLPDTLIDNCGTGMDSFKTFNISTASSIIAAAGGLTIARHGARAISSKCGTVDVAEELGVDVECPVDIVADSIISSGLGLFNGMSAQVHPNALGRILSQINFGSPLNIAASLANPAFPRQAVRGVYSKTMIAPVIEVMKKIGYQNALVIHGDINQTGKGIDEASVCGTTYCYHLTNGQIKIFEFEPNEVGLQCYHADEIAARPTITNSAQHIVRLLSGEEKGACEDIVVLNSALLFYVAKKVDSIEEGIELSRDLIENRMAKEKLQQWVTSQNQIPAKGMNKLLGYLKAA